MTPLHSTCSTRSIRHLIQCTERWPSLLWHHFTMILSCTSSKEELANKTTKTQAVADMIHELADGAQFITTTFRFWTVMFSSKYMYAIQIYTWKFIHLNLHYMYMNMSEDWGLTFVIRPELLEHASKFYGVKFRNKVTFSFYLLNCFDQSCAGVPCGLRHQGGGLWLCWRWRHPELKIGTGITFITRNSVWSN